MLVAMAISDLLKRLKLLDLEEQILNSAALLVIIGIFLPWTGGHMLGSDSITHSGFGFYTSFLGIAVFLLNLFIILMTAIPLTGGPILVRKRHKEHVRLFCGIQSAVLILAALSVLTKVSFEFSRMEIRFGIYVSLVGSLIVSLYAFLRLQEQRKTNVHELFHHPEEEFFSPPSVPPPAPSEPEEHHLHL